MPVAEICAICVRRERERGGTGSCPLLAHKLRKGEYERGVKRCGYFRIGDRKLKLIPPTGETPTLF